MSRSYRHIKEYEKEILQMKTDGKTKREISNTSGFTYEQVHNFISRYNEKQRKIAAGISILKTECIYRAKIRTYEEARLLVSDYIHFYNYQRIQTKTKLTPMEYRCQFVA